MRLAQRWSQYRLRRSVFAAGFRFAAVTGGVAQLLVVRHCMNTLVRLILLFFAVVVLVTAFRQHKNSANDRTQKQLSGTWTFEAIYPGGRKVELTHTFAPDGSFVETIIPNSTNGARIVSFEGTFRVEGAFIVETTTNEATMQPPTAHYPQSTERIRIARIDDRELVLHYEKRPGFEYPTNPSVYLKQTK